MANKDFYALLGVPRGCSPEDIKRAFRQMAMKYHPDKNPGREAEAVFLELREAYETLSDAGRRRRYDAGLDTPARFTRAAVRHRFTAALDRDRAGVAEEIRLSFTYTGEGRYFLRPDLKDFFLTGPPFVSFGKTVIDGVEVKETTLTYIIAPLATGTLAIGSARIRIDDKAYTSQPLHVSVHASGCYFSPGRPADGSPYRYGMHYEAVTGSEKRRLMKNVNHTVLIPRSHHAAVIHGIGRGLKIASAAWGMALCIHLRVSVFAGAVGGLLFGGAACHLFYLIAGVRSRFRYAKRYPVVQGYLSKGYRSGSDSGSQFINSEWVAFFNALVS